jgi:hypothetical protein
MNGVPLVLEDALAAIQDDGFVVHHQNFHLTPSFPQGAAKS